MFSLKVKGVCMKFFLKAFLIIFVTSICTLVAQAPRYPNHHEIIACSKWCKLSNDEKKERADSKLVEICGDCSNDCFKNPKSCDTEEK